VKSAHSPNGLMDRFKKHPVISRLIEGGELLEYSGHMLPEAGFDAIGELTGPGVLIVGDAAGLLNASLYKEGTNHAMESGRFAGLAVVEAKQAGDFSRTGLAGYERRLREEGIALKDVEKYRDLPAILEKSPDLLSEYPKRVNQLLIDYFSVGSEPKATVQKRARKAFWSGLPKWKATVDLFRARKLM